MLTKKKKIFMLAGMVILLAATVWLNATLAANADRQDANGGDVSTGSTFVGFRNERKTLREETIAYLDTILDTTEEEYAAKRLESLEHKQRIIKAMEQEKNIEYRLLGLGFDEVGVSIAATTDSITVMVKGELTQEVTAKIYQVIFEETGASANDVSMSAVLQD